MEHLDDDDDDDDDDSEDGGGKGQALSSAPPVKKVRGHSLLNDPVNFLTHKHVQFVNRALGGKKLQRNLMMMTATKTRTLAVKVMVVQRDKLFRAPRPRAR